MIVEQVPTCHEMVDLSVIFGAMGVTSILDCICETWYAYVQATLHPYEELSIMKVTVT